MIINNLNQLETKLFADGADIEKMLELSKTPYIAGLTTNPSLMRRSGVKDYKDFAKRVLSQIQDKPISFEVFSDDIEEMIQQAREIATWGKNVNVKIPITNSKGETTNRAVQILSQEGIHLNVTAILTIEQVENVIKILDSKSNVFISVFAGRIADTGKDPIPLMKESLRIMKNHSNVKLIWASPRELLNIIQANEIGCHIITATSDILSKLNLLGKDLSEYSIETVNMFRNDAIASGYSI
jgi:transaldolase